MKYTFVDGWRPNVDPQIAGKTLAAIAKEQGNIQPQIVVDQSRPKDAPLHPYFEWNNAKAGEMYRLDQASKLIRCVRIVKSETHGEPVLRRPFIHIAGERGEPSTYYPAATVMSRDDLRARAIGDAIAFLNRAKERLKEYRELEEESRAVGRIQTRLEKKTAKAA